jgi:hypothetical protein
MVLGQPGKNLWDSHLNGKKMDVVVQPAIPATGGSIRHKDHGPGQPGQKWDYLQNNQSKRTRAMTQVAVGLLTNCKALSSNPSIKNIHIEQNIDRICLLCTVWLFFQFLELMHSMSIFPKYKKLSCMSMHIYVCMHTHGYMSVYIHTHIYIYIVNIHNVDIFYAYVLKSVWIV